MSVLCQSLTDYVKKIKISFLSYLHVPSLFFYGAVPHKIIYHLYDIIIFFCFIWNGNLERCEVVE